MDHLWLRNKSILIKILLIVIGITMPLWIGADEVGLTSLLDELNRNPSASTLMITVFVLVMLNTLRALPHYIGALLLGDELSYHFQKKWMKVVIPLLIIPLVYIIINLYNPLNYDFGGPALLLLLSIILLNLIGKGRLRPVFKSFVLVQLLFGFQWLDMVIFLTVFGFGGGPISTQVKDIALELQFGGVLSFYSLVLCTVFMVNALALAIYLTVSEQKWQMTQDLRIAHGEIVESRSGREALHLVHDIKTPLALMEGLNSLIEMKTTDEDIKEYTRRISTSIQSTNSMVSEILNQKSKNWCTLDSLINYVRQNKLSNSETSYEFNLLADKDVEIYINKIRMTRAMVNLIDNASDAVGQVSNPRVTIHSKLEGQNVLLGVEDNGRGISKREQNNIWEPGYSTKAHPGVGLTFVKNVVEEHEADLSIETCIDAGTTFWITVLEESVRYEDSNHR
ncbi:sensor histidine kinase [Halobacillus naozhouensis]|uniref:histidine kinase n=1 Tax=Halobacillus naozhouensis TaxID=554880 RepID=A0ABY8IU21_9BACI|nr:HAMP domain-containing sensor histidine kinase [Halobacillus naozhouensis]WFT73237.1 HAMP domain-containing sensor histidine kinase [Halobacillus naozhouensis]